MQQTESSGTKAGTAPVKATGWYRWVVCGLIFAATSLLYVDRLTLGYLKTDLQGQYGWSETDYASVVQWFMFAYAVGFLLFGQIIDKLGAKRGYVIAVVVWTAAHLACAFVGFLPASWVLISFTVSYTVLGLGQGGNFPAALKVVAEWFPQRERSLAVGIFNAGTNLGAIVTPLIVIFVLVRYGWQWAIVATSGLSILWLFFWLPFYSKPSESKRTTKAEIAYIESDPFVPVKQLPWLTVLTKKETWAYGLGKFLTDPVWFLYSFWLPFYFQTTYHVQITGTALPVIIIFLISDVGSVFGGWMSSAMIKSGFTVNKARKLSMLICALLVMPMAIFSQMVTDMWAWVGIIGIAAAAHQAFSANLMTLTSDLMPKQAVGRCAGIGGTMGAIGGIIMAAGVGRALASSGGFTLIFIIAGVIYMVGLLVVHLISPRLKPADFSACKTV
jgi:MFS transporter, ACS family, hexuronate transporter